MLIRENVLINDLKSNYNGIQFKELPNIPKINLRGKLNDKIFIINTGKILNVLLPIEPNTSNHNDELKVIWLSPNEWLIEVYNQNTFINIFENLKMSLNEENTAVTDVTENKTIFRVSGKNLYKLLSKFMIIDLEETLKNISSVVQTIFIKVPVLIIRNHKNNQIQNIDIHVNRSHSKYVIELLIDGSKNLDF